MSDRDEDFVKLLETTDKETPVSKDASLDRQDQDVHADQLSQNEPGDRVPQAGEFDVDIPDEELTDYLQSTFKNDVADKEQMGFGTKRIQDDEMYHGITDPFFDNWPYVGASNFHVPMTQVFVDTGHAMIDDLEWRNRNKILTVSPVSTESAKKAKNLEWLLNWQGLNDIIGFQIADSSCNFNSLKNGTSYLKIIRSVGDRFVLEVINIEVHNIFMPIDSKSMEIKDCPRITQLIPWGEEDLRDRIASGKYRNLNKVGKGYYPSTLTAEQIVDLSTNISGLDMSRKIKRDTWWAAETYVTYYKLGSIKPMELIVTWAPQSGAILRKIENKDGIRPFVEKYYYPNYGKAFHYSMPEKFRAIQMKANYTDKQITDAADKAISPAGFYDGTGGFDPRLSIRVPTAMYRVKNLGRIQWEPVNIAAIMERNRHLQDLWALYERAAGFTDLLPRSKTLGQDILKNQRANTRFSGTQRLIEYHWKRTWDKIYEYDNLYMPRSVKVKVLGSNRYETIEKLFPMENLEENAIPPKEGIHLVGKYVFSIANKTLADEDLQNEKRTKFLAGMLGDQIFASDKGNRYRIYESMADANGIFDFENIIKRPKEASLFTPDEVIERMMDGEIMDPSLGFDIDDYLLAMRMFIRTGNFKDSPREVKILFLRYLTIAEKMSQANKLAFNDHNLLKGLQAGMLPGRDLPPRDIPSNNGKIPVPAGANPGG